MGSFAADMRTSSTAYAGLATALSASADAEVKALGGRLAAQGEAAKLLASFGDSLKLFEECVFDKVPTAVVGAVEATSTYWKGARDPAPVLAKLKTVGEVMGTCSTSDRLF